MDWKQRYKQAHERNFSEQYPQAYASNHYYEPPYPKTDTANGLTKAIINFLLWSGHRATRINSTGRIIKAPQLQQSGVSLMTAKYIPGTTRRGAADISATVFGRACQFEIKIGNDKPSEYQLREKALEEKAGGVYIFIHSMDEFIFWYDGFIKAHRVDISKLF